MDDMSSNIINLSNTNISGRDPSNSSLVVTAPLNNLSHSNITQLEVPLSDLEVQANEIEPVLLTDFSLGQDLSKGSTDQRNLPLGDINQSILVPKHKQINEADIVMWPKQQITKGGTKRKREKLPCVLTSVKWQEIQRNKQNEKLEAEEEKRIKRQKREHNKQIIEELAEKKKKKTKKKKRVADLTESSDEYEIAEIKKKQKKQTRQETSSRVD